jgi:flagellar biosynthesis protein FlhF
MNVQRFTGRTNKLALEQVRAAMGSEALILSNKRTSEGVEICAMLEDRIDCLGHRASKTCQ